MIRRRKVSEFECLDSDSIMGYLTERGYTVGEFGADGGWLAYAEKPGVRFTGTGAKQSEAWHDLIRNLELAKLFSVN